MKEKSGPFDAATSNLWDRIAALTEKAAYESARERQALLDEAESLRPAINFLEVAGTVDRDRAISVLATLLKYYVMRGVVNKPLEKALKDGAVKEIRSLLESLPERGKGGGMSKYGTEEMVNFVCTARTKETTRELRDAIIARLRAADRLCEDVKKKINIQAMDEGLWFIAQTAPEGYLQKELRELHAIAEKAIAEYEGKS